MKIKLLKIRVWFILKEVNTADLTVKGKVDDIVGILSQSFGKVSGHFVNLLSDFSDESSSDE